ncbi:MAG: rhodanese-like domain-containing protein [Nitrospinota bacterium]|nr:rhodanese-like domain-containing protein [Nitrospinota bacterium]
MDNISVDEFHDRVENLGSNDLILDVRSPGEFNEGHIKGAMNTNHEEVASIVDEIKQYQTVYVHCKMGGRAQMAAQILRDAGLSNIVCVKDGGMQRWQQQGWPIEK